MTAPTKTTQSELPIGAAVVKSGEPMRAPAVAVHADENGNISPSQLIMAAIDRGIPAESLEKLVALQERMSDRQAAIEFASAMAAFQQECPPIQHSKEAKITTKTGGSFKYTYAELDEIARKVNPILAKHGLSYSWDSSVDEKGVMLTCTCTVRHINGHVGPPSNFALPIANDSAMSPQQKVGAALTFAQRRTLSSALGLTTTDDDTDAAQVDPTPINDDQLSHLEDLITETKVNRARFLKFLNVEDLATLPAVRYKEAVNALEQAEKRRAAR